MFERPVRFCRRRVSQTAFLVRCQMSDPEIVQGLQIRYTAADRHTCPAAACCRTGSPCRGAIPILGYTHVGSTSTRMVVEPFCTRHRSGAFGCVRVGSRDPSDFSCTARVPIWQGSLTCHDCLWVRNGRWFQRPQQMRLAPHVHSQSSSLASSSL